MPQDRRAEKTIDKLRRGGLPAPIPDVVIHVDSGDGTRCSGCGETIAPTDMRHSVRLRGAIDVQFHDTCYGAWRTFKRP